MVNEFEEEMFDDSVVYEEQDLSEDEDMDPEDEGFIQGYEEASSEEDEDEDDII